MSANRSIAAAQRRRAAPQQPVDYQPRAKAPATSIASATNFQQPHSANMTGQLAGQYADVQQKQYLNSNSQSVQFKPTEIPQTNGISKMTIPQAITLITLRLGRIETHIQDMEFQNLGKDTCGLDSSSEQPFDNSALQEFNTRLTTLESSLAEFPQIKQQLEVYKPGIVSIKNMATANSKEIQTLKSQILTLQEEIKELSTRIQELEGLPEDENKSEETPVSDTSVVKTNTNTNEAINIKEMIKNELKLEITEKITPTFSSVTK